MATDRFASLDIGSLASLATIWEATAPKPGNVYRGADFADMTYPDFLISAVVTGPILASAATQGVGNTVLRAVEATRTVVGTNTNLGTLLLLTPLAAVPPDTPLREGIPAVLNQLTAEDTKYVYQAIGLAAAGGLGTVENADVAEPPPANLELVDAMRLAADRDLVARQYSNNFAEVFSHAVPTLAGHLAQQQPLADAIVLTYLSLLAEFGDSLIARKSGSEIAQQASDRAATCLESRNHGSAAYQSMLADFDFWLRADGNRRNPGTSADIIAATLFVLLREGDIAPPVSFYV